MVLVRGGQMVRPPTWVLQGRTQIHRKVATVAFFESSGGQHRGEATLPEVRLAVGEPAIDIGHVEQCLESLTEVCYFLTAEKNRYRFSFQANLNNALVLWEARCQQECEQARTPAMFHVAVMLGFFVYRKAVVPVERFSPRVRSESD